MTAQWGTTGFFAAASLLGMSLPVAAQVAATAAEQQEADYRVIAARCGTPAFEKTFSFQSRAAVAAGLVPGAGDTAAIEKRITALRRSPFVLVAAPADCPPQLKLLAELQKSRHGALAGKRAVKSR